MTNILVLGGIVALLAGLYMHVATNKQKYSRKTDPTERPVDVIYLPADLEAQKNTNDDVDDEHIVDVDNEDITNLEDER